MRKSARARSAVDQRRVAHLCQSHELLQRVGRHRGMDDDQARGIANHHDRSEILHRVEWQRLVDRRIGRVRIRGHQQGVAIRWRLGHHQRGDRAAGAPLVFDDDGLPENLAHAFRYPARHYIGCPARRERNNQVNRLFRKRRGDGRGRRNENRNAAQRTDAVSHPHGCLRIRPFVSMHGPCLRRLYTSKYHVPIISWSPQRRATRAAQPKRHARGDHEMTRLTRSRRAITQPGEGLIHG